MITGEQGGLYLSTNAPITQSFQGNTFREETVKARSSRLKTPQLAPHTKRLRENFTSIHLMDLDYKFITLHQYFFAKCLKFYFAEHFLHKSMSQTSKQTKKSSHLKKRYEK